MSINRPTPGPNPWLPQFMNDAKKNNQPAEEREPDGSLGCFYIETPCPNMPFFNYGKSPEFQKLRKQEDNLELARKYPLTPDVTAEVEVKGAVGRKCQQEAFVKATDADGDIEIPATEEEFALHVYETMMNRFGKDQVRLHPKSLPFKSRKPNLAHVEEKQVIDKHEALQASAAKAAEKAVR